MWVPYSNHKNWNIFKIRCADVGTVLEKIADLFLDGTGVIHGEKSSDSHEGQCMFKIWSSTHSSIYITPKGLK